jgi:hypothetical protein
MPWRPSGRLVEQAQRFSEAGDGRGALALLEVIVDEYLQLIDSERLFAFRALWFARDDQAALPGMEPDPLAGRRFRLGARLTGHDIAAAVGTGINRLVRHAPMSLAAFVDSLVPFIGEQATQVLADDYATLVDNPPALRLDTDTEAINEELGVPLTSVSDWARAQDWDKWRRRRGVRATWRAKGGVHCRPSHCDAILD